MQAGIGNFEKKPHPNDFVLKRTLKAPRKLVFECLTTPGHLVRFWAPKPFTTHECKVDLRPGGKWTYVFRSPEGQEHGAEHVYREIEPPARLVMEASVPGPDGKPYFTIRQTLLLEDRGRETDMTLEVKVLQANPGSEPFLGGARQGTGMTLDNLEEYLGTSRAGWRTREQAVRVSLFLLRAVSGLLFLQAGGLKLFGWFGGMPPGVPFHLFSEVGAAGILEFFGGSLILLGLFTRPAAFLLSGEMAVAYWQFHAPHGAWPIVNHGEPAVLFCFIFLYLSARGGGDWSLDAVLAKKGRAS